MNILSVIAASRRRAFDPLTLTPALWLDASDETKLFDATSGGSLPTNGNDIMRWEDKSGNARHFTQGTAAACPHRQTGVQNGLPVARFDGTDDVMAMVSGLDILRNKPGGSIVAIYRWVTNPTSSVVVASIQTTAATAIRLGIGGGVISRKLNVRARRVTADSISNNNSSANNPTDCFVHAGIVDYQNRTSKQYIDNSLDGSLTGILASGNTEDLDSSSVYIGGILGISTFCNIDLSEILVFDRAISDDDRNALHAYLVAKWGI